ncbi:ubiquitin carboxyl-terminal hydrolase 47-like [Hypanus sabinus]|uniref:ubiquitin carboxyl-terminal hydrolase 47-like n=1 Tax=Hypanus sabinus TaxID=79690 RepID=UPI0028C4AF46|nr:ubiquitin carboxyl-terminal hydrolase 47-like [Hypanus sabinus]
MSCRSCSETWCRSWTSNILPFYGGVMPQLTTVQGLWKKDKVPFHSWESRKELLWIMKEKILRQSKVNNAENHWHVAVVKDEKTPVQTQEVDQEDSVDITGRNPETPQDHSQQVSTGQEEKKYELFAIWHHSGIYGSGHYYAEIKSKSGNWYNFNDEVVEKENYINLSSKTAYMLMYRLTDTKPKAEARLREQRQEDAYAGGKRRREEANANEGHGGGKRRREEEEQKARHDGVESQ